MLQCSSLGGWSAWSGGGSPWSGGALPGPGGGFCLVPGGGGVLLGPGGDNPPVNRITDTCKNITLATTSLRPVISACSLY